jgi:phosphoenolpyruvate synthase/pyruvate phosphate dikinase
VPHEAKDVRVSIGISHIQYKLMVQVYMAVFLEVLLSKKGVMFTMTPSKNTNKV